MTDDPRVEQLLEELLEHDSTPEEVCRGSPELLQRVRERWQRLCNVQGEIDVLFPSPPAVPWSRATSAAEATSDLPLIPGYDVLEILGRGGVGVVYKAWHQRLHREIALKMLLAGEFAVPQELARFSREAELIAGLKHPNIVQVHDVGDHHGRPYFTMEYVDGGNLAKKLAGTPLPAHEAAALVALLAEAMHLAHVGGVVHRDLKPANILLTAAGVPKITDFGLARRMQGGSALTLSGATLGTPSYMAPEQAQGNTRAIGPAVDIYSLGALLYEMLTGRPPFRAETSLETQLQVVTQDPVTPSRLNARAPRDLETISLKCLHKDPARRYATAAELADDLHRFQRNEPITARPVGAFERAVKWVRRRPSQALLLTGSVLLTIGLLAYGTWRGVQRTATVHAAEGQLAQVIQLQQHGAWSDARSQLQLARFRLGTSGSPELERRLDQAGRELDFIDRLDSIRLERGGIVQEPADPRTTAAAANAGFEAAFSAAGIGTVQEDTQTVATRIVASNIRETLVGAVDEWTSCSNDPVRQRWLLDVAQRADSGPNEWRRRVRDPALWEDKAALTELAGTARVTEESVPMLLTLGRRLEHAGGDPIPMLQRLHQIHPDDLWVNFALGNAYRFKDPSEAVRYFQAMVAIRPVAATCNNLSMVLALSGKVNEAIETLRRGLELDPVNVGAHTNLGNCLSLAGRYEEALVEHRRSLQLAPETATPHANLGAVLGQMERWDDAIEELEKALEINPRHSGAHSSLCMGLTVQNRLDEAVAHGEESLRIDPKVANAHVTLAAALMASGRPAEAVEQCRQAIALGSQDTRAYSGMGGALFSLGRVDEAVEQFELALRIKPNDILAHRGMGNALAAQGRTDEAIGHFRTVVEAPSADAKDQFNLGLSLHDRGKFDEAAACFEAAIQVDPQLFHAHAALGRTRLEQGRFREAATATQKCLDLMPAQQQFRGQAVAQLHHCERLLALDVRLPDVRAGKDEPTGAPELMQFSELCQLRREYGAAASFAEQAFAAAPSLAEDPRGYPRYNAACCAALAGCGEGQDVPGLSDAQRAQWRARAREWLRADLALHVANLKREPLKNGPPIARVMKHWLADPDLALLRDRPALANLEDAERQEWRRLWVEVEMLIQDAGGSR